MSEPSPRHLINEIDRPCFRRRSCKAHIRWSVSSTSTLPFFTDSLQALYSKKMTNFGNSCRIFFRNSTKLPFSTFLIGYGNVFFCESCQLFAPYNFKRLFFTFPKSYDIVMKYEALRFVPLSIPRLLSFGSSPPSVRCFPCPSLSTAGTI
jgi:hypothetical protein